MAGRITFLMIFVWSTLQGQGEGWNQYFSGNTRRDLAARGNDVLISLPNIGLVHFDTSGNKTFYTTLNSNLPSRFAGALDIAPDGTWWVQFVDSIGHFDGSQWTMWNSEAVGITVSKTTQIKASSDGNIYVCTETEGLAVYNGVDWQILNTTNQSLPGNHIVSISFGPNGEKCIVGQHWVMVDNNGTIAVFDSTSTGIQTFRNLKSAVLLPNNTLWVASQLGELYCLKNNIWNTIIRSSIGIVGAAYAGNWMQDPEGNLWINFSRSLAKYDGTVWSIYNADELECEDHLQDPTPALAMDGSGKFWVKSCNLWTIHNDFWEKISTGNSGLNNGIIRDVVETSSGEVWFATTKGIFKKKQTNWIYFSPDDYLAGEDVSSVTCDSSGNIWFGTDALEILRFDGNNWTKWDTLISLMPQDYDIGESIFAPDGSVWFFLYPHYIDGENYAVQFLNNTWNVFSSDNAPFDFAIHIRNLKFGNDGTYWFHTSTRIVSLKDGLWKYYDETNSPLPGKDMYGMTIDPDGKIWVSTNEGLYYFENDNWLFATDLNNRLPLYSQPELKRIDFDASGKLYMTMSYRGEPFTSIVAITDSTITSMIPPGFDPKYTGSFTNIFTISVSNRLWINGPFDRTILEYNPNPPMFAPPPPSVDNRSILVFPNPTSLGLVSLLFDFDAACEVQINIFDEQGQLRGTQNIAYQPGQTTSFNIQNLSSGLYNIQAVCGTNMRQGKMIKF